MSLDDLLALAIVLEPCMDGSCGARALFGSGSVSAAVMYTASEMWPDKIAGTQTCRADSMQPDRIVFDTVRRFKGLSRPCVFLVGLEGLTDPELIYVATSSANLLLEMAGTVEDIARITQNTNTGT